MKRYYMYIKVDIISSICFMLHCIIIMLSYNTLATCEQYRWAVLFAAVMFICKWDKLTLWTYMWKNAVLSPLIDFKNGNILSIHLTLCWLIQIVKSVKVMSSFNLQRHIQHSLFSYMSHQCDTLLYPKDSHYDWIRLVPLIY